MRLGATVPRSTAGSYATAAHMVRGLKRRERARSADDDKECGEGGEAHGVIAWVRW
jgi:hypothetical protein